VNWSRRSFGANNHADFKADHVQRHIHKNKSEDQRPGHYNPTLFLAFVCDTYGHIRDRALLLIFLLSLSLGTCHCGLGQHLRADEMRGASLASNTLITHLSSLFNRRKGRIPMARHGNSGPRAAACMGAELQHHDYSRGGWRYGQRQAWRETATTTRWTTRQIAS
jgi:hypothetical protein